ncbi:phosphopyruvate hydratase [bacterium]|nr:phosphopyruvate hydratase [bacterium]
MISVIIPTLNEENYLPLLLKSLKQQTYKNFEVIVADAGSSDDTVQIAKNWGCKVIEGGMPAVGRNNGARVAKGDILIFLDADVVLPKEFLEETLKEFKKRKLDIASSYMRVLSGKSIDSLMYNIVNIYLGVSQFLKPKAVGHFIMVKKKIHRKIGGFDETIKVAEDFDYIQRASKVGKFRYLTSCRIPVSVRRLDKEGRIAMATKYVLIGIYFDLFGGVKSDIFRYRFGHYAEEKRKESLKEKIKEFSLKMKMIYRIKSLRAREILDSRGNPTVEVELMVNNKIFRASCPAGASKGKYEAKELRDGGKRYLGKGVRRAVENINKIIAPAIRRKYVINQRSIDSFLVRLDGKKDKSHLGANALIAVSEAVCRAGADVCNKTLYSHIADIYNDRLLTPSDAKFKIPLACFNIINGGAHAGNDLAIQEFMIIPQDSTFSFNLRMASEIYHELKKLLERKFGKFATNLGDEGGFAPPLKRTSDALNIIMKAIKKADYLGKVRIGLDAAATQFYRNKKYWIDGKKFSQDELINYYKSLIKKFPILFIEDPFAEQDFEGFRKAKQLFPREVFILGDDLLVTNVERIKKAHTIDCCSGAIIKPNQIGTVSEAIEAAKLVRSYGWKVLVSHRSGDTTDSFIADLAVGVGADFIKAGAPARGERVEKYNRLLRIEEELKQK